MDIKEIRQLVKLYFDYNPQNNRGIAWKAKAFDIINAYANTHNKTYEEIEECIKKYKATKMPIWSQFFHHFYNNKEESQIHQKSQYKNTINDSTDADEWI